jgi:hypothetical protein
MLTDQKHRLAPYLAAFKSEPSRFLSTVQVGLNIVGVPGVGGRRDEPR